MAIKNFIRDILPKNLLEWYKTQQVKKQFDSYRYDKEENNLLKAFDKHKVLFIHIPKTAGISVRESLFATSGFGKHVTAIRYKYYYGAKTFNSYFKFAFVRNPWARTLSAYHFLQKGGINEQDQTWADTTLTQYKNFEDFVMNGLHTPEVINWVHFLPQYTWICDHKQRNLMDFTGRLENIQQDYEIIRQKTSLGHPLIHKNKGADIKAYREHYTEAMQKKVAEIYKTDLKLFKYSF